MFFLLSLLIPVHVQTHLHKRCCRYFSSFLGCQDRESWGRARLILAFEPKNYQHYWFFGLGNSVRIISTKDEGCRFLTCLCEHGEREQLLLVSEEVVNHHIYVSHRHFFPKHLRECLAFICCKINKVVQGINFDSQAIPIITQILRCPSVLQFFQLDLHSWGEWIIGFS